MPLRRLKKLNTTDCLWVYVLRILRDEPMHAYALRKAIEQRFGFKPGTVTAYKVLYLLTRSGLVTKQDSGRQVVYRITDKGKKMLEEAVVFYGERAKLLK